MTSTSADLKAQPLLPAAQQQPLSTGHTCSQANVCAQLTRLRPGTPITLQKNKESKCNPIPQSQWVAEATWPALAPLNMSMVVQHVTNITDKCNTCKGAHSKHINGTSQLGHSKSQHTKEPRELSRCAVPKALSMAKHACTSLYEKQESNTRFIVSPTRQLSELPLSMDSGDAQEAHELHDRGRRVGDDQMQPVTSQQLSSVLISCSSNSTAITSHSQHKR